MLNATPLPPLAGILPRESRRAEAGAGAGRAAALGGIIPRRELLPLPLRPFPSFTAMHPAWRPGNLLLEPSHLFFFLGSWISYKTSPPAFFKSLSDCGFSHPFFFFSFPLFPLAALCQQQLQTKRAFAQQKQSIFTGATHPIKKKFG